MTPEQIEELWCLKQSNDATSRPAAISKLHWDDGIRYSEMVEAGYVKRYARQPRGFSNQFFGAKITDAGSAFIEQNRLS